MGQVKLAVLDMLPAHSSIAIELERAEDGGIARVRFVATNAQGVKSLPSGWFDAAAAPIHLAWSAFEFPAALAPAALVKPWAMCPDPRCAEPLVSSFKWKGLVLAAFLIAALIVGVAFGPALVRALQGIAS